MMERKNNNNNNNEADRRQRLKELVVYFLVKMFKWSWIIWIQTLNQPAERLFRERLSCSDRLFSSIIHPLFVRLCFSLARFSPVVSVHPSFLCVEAAAGGITRPTGRTGEHGRLSALIGPFSFYSSGFSPSSPLSLCPLSSLTHTLTHSHTHTHTHLGASAGITQVL